MFRVLILKDKMGDLSDKIFSLRWSTIVTKHITGNLRICFQDPCNNIF